MPKIQFKEPTLNGRAFVIAYADREYLYLRIPRGDRKYSNVSLGTTDLKVAHNKALDVYTETVNEPPRSRSKRYGFKLACAEYLKWKAEQAEIGQLRASSVGTYEQRIYQRIIPFAKLVGVTQIGDLTKQSFEGYGEHYRRVETKGKWSNQTNGLSVSTINSDLSTLNELFGFLVKRDLLDPRKFPELVKLKDKKDYREEANPAFFPDEWEAFKDVLKKYVAESTDDLQKWKRQWLLNWVFFMYHGGFRCHEAMALRIGDVGTRKMPDGSLKGIVQVPATTKTGKRTTIMNGHWLNGVKYHLNKGVKLRNQQIELHNKKVEDGTIERWRKIKTKIDLIPFPLPKDTLLFSNPFGYFNKASASVDMSPFSSEHIRQEYNALLKTADFDKKYTLHSLRSTHITHALLKKMRIRVIADNVGGSEQQLEATYYRLNNLLNIEELGFHRIKAADNEALVSGG